jgi:pimeloyl-ACP methyl ester carboxylesterase
MTPRHVGHRRSVDGLEMYFEVHGAGRPLVLLHGCDLDDRDQLPGGATSPRRDQQVVAIEQQAHGHTPDIDRPLTYRQMADDTAASSAAGA